MNEVKVKLVRGPHGEITAEIETAMIQPTADDAREAGANAFEVLSAFTEGMNEAAGT